MSELPSRLAALSVSLPAGRPVHGDEGDADEPAMWVSEAPATAELWRALLGEHPRSGLWPLLLDSLHGSPGRPWDDGELWPAPLETHDAGTLMAGWWAAYTANDDEDDMLSPAQRLAVTAPFGRDWPGPAPAQPLAGADPGTHAADCAADLLLHRPGLRLGLVAADRGSDALTLAGWDGATNYSGPARISAVLRTWEDRFGVRVIGAGFADLFLSVAAPPSTESAALHVAAEHFAFCPDNVWQGTGSLPQYAGTLRDAGTWQFWWD